MQNLICEYNLPPVEGLDANQMTVGRHFELKCKGDILATSEIVKEQLKIDTASSPNVRLFKLSPAADKAILMDLTLYQVGEYRLNQLILTDGQSQIQLSGPDIKVTSVLKPPADGKPQEPYGSIFPLSIPIPSLYLFSLAGFLLLFLSVIVLKVRQTTQLRELKKKLKQYDSPVAPDTQFYKSIRSAEKNEFNFVEIQKAFLLYNVRSYKIPLFELDKRKAIQFFKNEHPSLKKTRQELHKFLNELAEYVNRQSEISKSDKEELVRKMYRYVETHRGLE